MQSRRVRFVVVNELNPQQWSLCDGEFEQDIWKFVDFDIMIVELESLLSRFNVNPRASTEAFQVAQKTKSCLSLSLTPHADH